MKNVCGSFFCEGQIFANIPQTVSNSHLNGILNTNRSHYNYEIMTDWKWTVNVMGK